MLPPFQSLLDEHGPAVHRFLRAAVGATEADDVYQETWIAALGAYPRLGHADNLRGWLLTIAHRKALDHFRARRRAPLPSDTLPERAGESAAGEPELWAAVRALPPKQRGAIALRYGLDADYAVIAQALGCSPEAARRSVHEGLRRLRERYER